MSNILVLVDGNEIPQTLAIVRIRVTHVMGELASAEIEMAGVPAEGAAVPDPDGATFVPGGTIEILLGREAQLARVFVGVIVARHTTLVANGSALVLQCAHPLYRSALARRNRVWVDSTDAGCIATLCEEHGVAVRVAGGGIHHPLLVQSAQSDWEFLRARAAASGLLLLVDSEGLQARPPGPAEAPLRELQVGTTVIELALATDLREQPAGVEVHGWDPAQQELLRIAGDEPALPGSEQQRGVALAKVHGQMRRIDVFQANEAAMQSLASSQLLKARLAAKSGHVRVYGLAELAPGQWVSLRGAGALLDGEMLVTRVEHRVQQGDWVTEIGIGDPFPLQQDPGATAAGTMMPSLHPGVVHALEGDPENEGRIQISLPMLGEDASPVWARLVSPDAGRDRGVAFFPEIGDEVVVGISGGAAQPVVLGSLHSSARPGPIAPNDVNHRKGYFSRSGLKCIFDDELKSITLSTPAGNVLALSDGEAGIRLQDAHGNRITMDATGIRIESASDLAVKSTKKTRVDAHDLHLKADAQLEVEGAAGTVLESAGTVTIRGAIVTIN